VPLDVDPTVGTGMWLRHIPAGGEVDWQPPDPGDARWQRGHIVDALYFAQSAHAMWAEFYRHLAESGLPPEQAMPRDVWTWELALPEVADLSSEARLERVGLPFPEPGRRTWPPFQTIGEQLWHEEWAGLICPSACHVGSLVVCVFREHRHVAGATPVPPPTRLGHLPPIPTGLRT
jgi:RES domain-containing protein